MDTVGRVDEVLGSYRLVAPIGRGGMGEVWRAEHVQIHSIVAIKLILGDADAPETAARFLREAKATARIRHPGIVAVTDYGERSGGGAYMVMELLEGQPLSNRLLTAIDRESAIEIAAQIAEALAAAHGAGVIHRDLKPANVFLVRDAASRAGVRVKLLDFGVAKSTSKVTDDYGLTVTGALVGTPLYMAPEQCTSRRGPVDHRADLYALGVVLYEMLTGKPPFIGPALGDVIEQHLHDSPASIRDKVPAWLDELVMLLLAKQREDRPAHAAIVARALRGQTAPRISALQDARAATDSVVPALAATVGDTRRSVEIDATVDSAAIKPSAQLPVTLGIPEPQAPITTSSPPKRSKAWFAVGGLAVAAIGVTAFGLTRGGSGEPPKPPPLDLSKLDAAGLAAACDGGNGEACLRVADSMLASKAPDLARVFSRVQAACDAGTTRGCTRVAAMHLRGIGVRPDPALARTTAERTCEAKDGAGCDLLAEMSGKGMYSPVDHARAQELWTKGCDLGEPSACFGRARAAQYGLGTKRDPALATQLYARGAALSDAGCAKGDAEGCRGVALTLYRGTAGTKDMTRAVMLMDKACELGSGDACSDIGQLRLLGSGINKDPPRAEQLLRRGCEIGSPDACTALSIALGAGLFGAQDAKASMEVAKRACENHGDQYCTQVGRNYSLGIGAPRDPEMVRVYFERGCKGGDPEGCSGIADLKIDGKPQDPDKAFIALSRACMLGSTVACQRRGKVALKRGDTTTAFEAFELACGLSDGEIGCPELATMYFDGVHVEKDPERATKLLVGNCNNAMQVNCHALGERLRDGNGMPASPAEAALRFEKACELGWGKSCVALADMLSAKDQGLSPDPAKAAALRDKACKLEARFCPKPEAKAPKKK